MGHTFSTGNRDCYFNIYTPLVLTAAPGTHSSSRRSQFGLFPGVLIFISNNKKWLTKSLTASGLNSMLVQQCNMF